VNDQNHHTIASYLPHLYRILEDTRLGPSNRLNTSMPSENRAWFQLLHLLAETFPSLLEIDAYRHVSTIKVEQQFHVNFRKTATECTRKVTLLETARRSPGPADVNL
jgi:hypothetical protein